jgi:phage portal protein BeeE
MTVNLNALAKKINFGFNFGESFGLYPQLNPENVANDYRSMAGELEDNYVVGGLVNFFFRKMQEVTLVLQEEVKPGKWNTYEGPYNREPLLLFEEANEYFGGKGLYYAVIRDLLDWGNSYVLILEKTNGLGVHGYVYLERDRVEPFTKLINGVSRMFYRYTYKNGGQVVYPARLVCHFKWGIDRREVLMGVPMIRGAIKEIANDTALSLTSTNKADRGNNSDIVFTADSDNKSPKGQLTLASIKKLFQLWRAGSREGAGLPMFIPLPVKMHTKGYSPQELQISQQRSDLASRIATPIGLDVMVLGLPSDNKTYSNYKEAIGNAVENAFLPLIGVIADTLSAKLKPYTGMESSVYRIHFDTSQIKGLQEGITAKHERLRLDFRSNMVTLGTVQEELNYPLDTENADKYFSELVALGNTDTTKVEDTSGKAKNEQSG